MEVKEISSVLKDVYEGEISVEDAVEDIELASPLELALAEVELLDEDLDENSLREFRDLYDDIIVNKTEDTLEKLDEDHPIHHLIEEHIQIKKFVEELSEFSESLQNEKTRIIRKKKLDNIGHNVDEIKRHEKSEEDILFPRLKDKGFAGRVNILENEHDEIDKLMDKVKNLSEDVVDNKEVLAENIDVLAYTLNFHSFMENNFLYLVALEELNDWYAIKKEFRDVGMSNIFSIKENRTRDQQDVEDIW